MHGANIPWFHGVMSGGMKNRAWRQTDVIQIWAVQHASYFLSLLICQMAKINGISLFGIL